MHVYHSFHTRQNLTKFLGENKISNQHNLMSRSLSILESQEGNAQKHNPDLTGNSERLETSKSPISFDFCGGQHQLMKGQQSGMPQSQPRQQLGFNEMKLWQQQLMFKQLQELQRQQQLQQLDQEVRQQNPMDTPICDASNYLWQSDLMGGDPKVPSTSQMCILDNMNWTQCGGSPAVQGIPNRFTFSHDQGPLSHSSGLVPHQLNRSLYGAPIASTRGSLNQYHNLQGISRDRVDMLTNVGGNQVEKALRYSTSSNNSFQSDQDGPSLGLVSLDPIEEKILFNTDDKFWDASFGGIGSCGNPLEGTDYLNAYPSLQSGSWSALMQSAVAEASSGDTGMQDEWSGLSYQNEELSTGNQSGNQQINWVDNNLQSASSLTSTTFPQFDDANKSLNGRSIDYIQQPNVKISYKQSERIRPDASYEPIHQSPNFGFQQKPSVNESCQIQPSMSSYNNGGASFNKLNDWNANESRSPSHSNERCMHMEREHNDGMWKTDGNQVTNSIPNSIDGLEQLKSVPCSVHVNREDDPHMDNFTALQNSSTTKTNQETSEHLAYVKHVVDSSVKYKGDESLGKYHNQHKKGPPVLESFMNNSDLGSGEKYGKKLENFYQKEIPNYSYNSNQLHAVPGEGVKQNLQLSASDSRENTTKHVTHSRPLPPQFFRGSMNHEQNYFGPSKFVGHVPDKTMGMEKGHLDFRANAERSVDVPFRGVLPGYESLVSGSLDGLEGFCAPNKMPDQTSQNMLELLNKVDQEKHFSSSDHKTSSEAPEPSASDTSVTHFGQNQFSSPQGFGLHLAPSSQQLLVSNPDFSSQNSSHTVNNINSRNVDPEVGKKGQTWLAPPFSVQSFPHEMSQREHHNNKSSVPQFRMKDDNINAVVADQSSQASVSGASGRIPPFNLAPPTFHPIRSNRSLPRSLSQKLSILESLPISQPSVTSGMSQQGAFSTMLHNVWTNVSTKQCLSAETPNKVSSNLVQSTNASNNNLEPTSLVTQKPDGLPMPSENVDIEAFSHSLKPSQVLHQNYSLLHQVKSMKGYETDPTKRDGKRFKGADNKMLSFSSEVGEDQNTNASSQDVVMFGRNNSHINSSHLGMTSEDVHISPQMAPSWFKQYGTFKNGQLMPMYDAQKEAKTSPQDFVLGKASESMHSHTSTEQVNAGDASQVGKVRQSTITTMVASESIFAPHSLPAEVTDERLAIVGPKKRKSTTLELLPWHIEVTHGSQRLQNISMAEQDWMQATNRLIEKVEDEGEMLEDGQQMLRQQRRLVLTTQLMQQLLRPAPAAILSTDATSDYETVTYFVSKLSLGDACSVISCSGSDLHVLPESGNMTSAKLKNSERLHDQYLSKVVEDFIGRARKLETDLLRLDKKVSILDVRVECQDLERFSVINRFAKFHGRGHTDGPDTSFSSNTASNTQKTCPQRYVTALPMPKNLPVGVQCLTLASN